MPTDLLGQIHSSIATTSPDWDTFRGEVTGMYLLSGQGGEWDSQHLIREYNRNINSLYKSWTPTEPNATGLFIEPYNAGFSYQGTGDFRDYKWDTYSLDFDGVDDYVELGSQAGALRLYNSNGTISAWIKIDDVSAGDTYKRIVDKSDGGGGANGYCFFVHTDGTIAGFMAGTGTYSAVCITDATWHHVVWTWDGTNSKYYVDGALVTTASETRRPVATTTNMRIGTWNHDVAREFQGKMDEVAIFDSALSAVQIRAIYNGGTPESLTPYSPVSWWRMGDGPLDDGSDKIIGDQMNLTLGSELITNGNFASDTDWTKAAGWSIAGGVASCDGTQASFASLIQDHVHTINKACVLEFDLVSTNGEGLKYWVNGSQVIFDMVETSVGHKKYTFFTNVGGKAYFEAYSDFVGSITNVSVKDYNGNQGGMKNMTASDIVADTPISNKWDVYSVIFDGVDEYVNTPYVVPAISTLTISAWFKHDGTKGGNQFIISDWGAAGSWAQSGRGLLGFYGKTVMIVMSDGINYYYARSADTYDASAFFDDAWHHAVITIDTETQKFYLDGALVHTHDTTDAGTRTGGTSAVLGTAGTDIEVIGRAGSYAGDYWEGSIDEVAIWESVLSAAQVLAIYNGGVPADLASLSPENWWRMGDGDYYRILHDAAATDTNALYLPAVNSNYASVPDAADLDGFGDFTFELTDVTVPDWTPSGTNTLISKYASASKSWNFQLLTSGKLAMYLSFDGSAETGYLSTVATGITDGSTASIRLIRSGTDLTFELDTGSGYSQLGTTVTVSASALHAGTRDVMIGTHESGTVSMFGGSIGRARIWSDATQSTNVLDANFALATKGEPSFTATSGQTVTINTTAIADPAVIRGATDGVIVNDAALRADTP